MAYRGLFRLLEEPMLVLFTSAIQHRIARWRSPHGIRPFLSLFALLIVSFVTGRGDDRQWFAPALEIPPF
jgi:hypothetical protein